MDYKKDLERALRLADTADEIGLKYYRAKELKITIKSDSTPVTQADLEIEKALSTIVTEEFREAYEGEEGTKNAQSHRRWLVDPIDGTKNFTRHMPVWGPLISLSDNGIVVAAVVSAPALGLRWWASKGSGSFKKNMDGSVNKIHVSKINNLKEAFVSGTNLIYWEKSPIGLEPIISLLRKTYRHRLIGDFWSYMLVAEGAADVHFETATKGWDVEAPAFIVNEAGGKVWTDATSSSQESDNRMAIATNGLLEKQVLDILGLKP